MKTKIKISKYEIQSMYISYFEGMYFERQNNMVFATIDNGCWGLTRENVRQTFYEEFADFLEAYVI